MSFQRCDRPEAEALAKCNQYGGFRSTHGQRQVATDQGSTAAQSIHAPGSDIS